MLIQVLVFFVLYRNTLADCGHNHSAVQDHYDCGCCSGISNNNGRVVGFHCHKDDQNSILRYASDEENPIEEYCCFWSPNLGCTILVNEKYFSNKDVCNNCKYFCQRTTGDGRSSRYPRKLILLLSLLLIGCTY
ncbi:uncharacterized protein Dsimw501_GD17217, isoform B [Drosophila simulans]|uniref:Uncharacterized protein, isoform B n=1 Tax=Drosophila simulans TaxID=7240 RepID=A0A0J9RYC4_DROSI|nr:uncharacterized protein LOC6726031 isoform X2 [Drosophila simulans]KMZ00652.1 uncharacterized protein Dsimw501_GD17217, isoform B [Drosophila simulans]